MIIDSVSRIAISGIAALIVSMVYKVGFVSFQMLGNDAERVMEELLCIIAGFSERLAPSLMEKIVEGKAK